MLTDLRQPDLLITKYLKVIDKVVCVAPMNDKYGYLLFTFIALMSHNRRCLTFVSDKPRADR